jgi:hypothetical protein
MVTARSDIVDEGAELFLDLMRTATNMRGDVWLGIVIRVALVLLAACSPGKGYESGRIRIYEGLGFTARLRSEVLVNAASPGEGFRLYDFHVGSRPLLFAYVGNQPNAPHFKWPGEIVDTELKSGLQGTCRLRREQASSRVSRECLFTLGDEFPQKLHIWYEKLDDDSRQMADAIVESLATAPR